MSALHLLTILASGLVDVTSPPDPIQIVGGELVPPGQHPAVVAVGRGSLSCTGTLLTPDLVLTAAHCVIDPSTELDEFHVTARDPIVGSTHTFGVTAFGMHPRFCNFEDDPECLSHDGVFDYAWLRLDGQARVDPSDIPVIVTNDTVYSELIHVGAELLLVGYGENEEEIFGEKRQVVTEITWLSPTGTELRAGSNGRDSCRGDSGGPAFARLDDGRLALVGVLSRGDTVCGEGGIYGATLAGLCWVRDDSGTDVVPPECGGCDCVDLDLGVDDDVELRGCSVGSPDERDSPVWALGWLLLGARPWAARRNSPKRRPWAPGRP
jgi:MYXO-CTERM domain-containing protein